MKDIKYCCNFYLDGVPEDDAMTVGHWLTELTPMMAEKHLIFAGADEYRERLTEEAGEPITNDENDDFNELLDWVCDLQRELDLAQQEVRHYKTLYNSEKVSTKALEVMLEHYKRNDQ